jgi:hypothetical protein
LDEDDGIIAVADLPVAPLQDALFIDDADNTVADASHDDEASDADSDADSDNDDSNDEDSEDDDNDDNDDDNDNDNDHGADGIAGTRRSRRVNKGRTTRYDNYALLLHARRIARGGPRRAVIKDGFTFFSGDDLSNAKPIPVEDRLEYALGIILQQYAIWAGLKKFQDKAKKGSRKNWTKCTIWQSLPQL